MVINQRARAKINLCLHLTGQRADGYHLLDSLVVFADVADKITVEAAQKLSLNINGPFSGSLTVGADNLVIKAAQTYQGLGAKITLQKNLPIASGIGGGSADAAASLRALSELSSQPLPADNGLSLGADVPVCLFGQACRMQGIGEDITPVSSLPPLPAVLVWPNVAVSTATVFQSISQKENPAISMLVDKKMEFADTVAFLKTTRNDMQYAARQLAPEISDALEMLEHSGADLARMSGSGATCFGLFKDHETAAAAAQEIAECQPDWWVRSTVLNDT